MALIAFERAMSRADLDTALSYAAVTLQDCLQAFEQARSTGTKAEYQQADRELTAARERHADLLAQRAGGGVSLPIVAALYVEKGVGFRCGKWVARISVNGKRIQVGSFSTKCEAESAYAEALEKLGSTRIRKQRVRLDPRERFLAKIEPQPGGCHLWTGAKDKDGYGKYQLNGEGRQQHVRAHRYAFFLRHGVWPSKNSLHSCDTPSCVNPDHLRDGSQSENLIDCAERGRRKSIRLTVDSVRIIRARHAAGESVTAIAAEIGVPRETLFAAVHRRTWSHVA